MGVKLGHVGWNIFANGQVGGNVIAGFVAGEVNSIHLTDSGSFFASGDLLPLLAVFLFVT